MYRGWYKHWLVEEVQETTSLLWDETAHPHWISTRDYEGTKEEFYISKSRTAVDGDDNDILENIEDDVLWNKMMPDGMRWLAKAEGTLIPATQLRTKQEKALFEANYRRFMTGRSSSANCFDAVDYSAFAEWWEKQVCTVSVLESRPFLRFKSSRSDAIGKVASSVKTVGSSRSMASSARQFSTSVPRSRVSVSHSSCPTFDVLRYTVMTLLFRAQAGTARNDATLTIRDANVGLRADLRDPDRDGSAAFREPLPLPRQATVPAASNVMDEDMEPVVRQSSHRVVVRDWVAQRASLPLTTAPPPPTQGIAPSTAQPPPTQSMAPTAAQPSYMQGIAQMTSPPTATHVTTVPMFVQPPPTQTTMRGQPPPTQTTMRGQPPPTHFTAPMFGQPPPMHGTAPMFGQPAPTQQTTFRRVDLSSGGTYKDPRCRRCGRYKVSDPIARGKHEFGRGIGRDHWRFCKVAPDDYMPGYPKPGYETRIFPPPSPE